MKVLIVHLTRIYTKPFYFNDHMGMIHHLFHVTFKTKEQFWKAQRLKSLLLHLDHLIDSIP